MENNNNRSYVQMYFQAYQLSDSRVSFTSPPSSPSCDPLIVKIGGGKFSAERKA